MRVCVLGPPASGKSTVAGLLCKKYKLHHVTIKDVIDETMERLEASAARLEAVCMIVYKLESNQSSDFTLTRDSKMCAWKDFKQIKLRKYP